MSYSNSPFGSSPYGSSPYGGAQSIESSDLKPLNITMPRLNGVGLWNVGTWDDRDNGSILFTVTLYSYTNDTEIEVLQTSSPNTSGTCIETLTSEGYGEYYIIVSAENDGGNDPSEDTWSNIISFIVRPPFRPADKTRSNQVFILQDDSIILRSEGDEYVQSVQIVSDLTIITHPTKKIEDFDMSKFTNRFKKPLSSR